MRRRAFLASSTALLASAAGCGGGPGSSGTSPGSGDDRPPVTAAGPPSGDVQSTRTPTSPAPDPAGDAFADFGCPSFDATADRTLCYHAVDPSATDVVLGVDPEVFDPDPDDSTVEALEFTLYNRSAWHLHVNPDGWGVERLVDDGFVHVAPDGHDVSVVALPPGETYTWELPSELHPTPFDPRYELLDFALSAGTYAFHVACSFDAEMDPAATPTAEPPDERFECVGLFRLEEDVDPSGGTPRTNETST